MAHSVNTYKPRRLVGMKFSHEDAILKLPARKLAALLEATEAETVSWHEDEYLLVLEHQLDAFLSSVAPTASAQLTFRQFFRQGASLDLILACKDWAKRNLRSPNSALPHEVSTVLYYALICKGRIEHAKPMTALNDQSLLNGIDWCLRRKWLPPLLGELFLATKSRSSAHF